MTEYVCSCWQPNNCADRIDGFVGSTVDVPAQFIVIFEEPHLSSCLIEQFIGIITGVKKLISFAHVDNQVVVLLLGKKVYRESILQDFLHAIGYFYPVVIPVTPAKRQCSGDATLVDVSGSVDADLFTHSGQARGIEADVCMKCNHSLLLCRERHHREEQKQEKIKNLAHQNCIRGTSFSASFSSSKKRDLVN